MLASSPTLFKNVFTWKQSENNRSRWQMTLPLLQWNSEWVPLPLIHRTGKRWHGAAKDIPTNPFTSVLEWVYSLRAAKWLQSCLVWTVARQAPLSMGFSRQEYWSGLLCPSPLSFPTLILFIICTFIYCLSPPSNARILRAKDLFCLLFPPLHLSETVPTLRGCSGNFWWMNEWGLMVQWFLELQLAG